MTQTRIRKLDQNEKRLYAELYSIQNLLTIFPTGIVSYVSDTYNLWDVCSVILPKIKNEILSRDGKLVIRPDSGDPVDIVCGFETQNINGELYHVDDIVERWAGNYLVSTDSKPIEPNSPEIKGVVELLWDVFGGTINSKGYKVLDNHIGVIYGDSISLERADAICKRLEQKGFASNNVVFGIGSYTYNYNTRDSLGIAVKSTYCVVDGEDRNIFKDPVTDNGLKKSAKGLLKVEVVNGKYVLYDEVSIEEEKLGELEIVYENGKLYVDHSLKEIRDRLEHKKLSWQDF